MQAQLPVTGPDTREPEVAGTPDRAHPARGARVVAWASLAVSVLATAATGVLDAITPDAARAAANATVGWIIGLPGLALAVPGAVLLHRAPRNAVSWVLAATGLLWALDGLAQSWLVFAVQSDPPLPGASLAFWFVQRFGAALLLGLPLLLLLYPDGRLPGGVWRPLAIGSLVSTALLPALLTVVPSEIAIARAGEPLPPAFGGLDLDPISIPLPAAVALPLLQVAFPVALLGVLVPVASVVARLRASTGEDRRRMRWLVWAGVVDVLVMLGALVVPGDATSLGLSLAVALTGVAVTLGILRPRAVDIDRLLGGTLVYGALAVGVVLLDLAVLAGAGALVGGRLAERDSTLLTLLVVALVYAPLRAPLWRLVRRWLLGEREDPYRVVSGLAERLERSDGADEQLMAIAAAVAEAFRSPYVGVEVESAGGTRMVAEHGRRPVAVRALPIAYRGEEVGRLLLPRDGVRAQLMNRD